MSDGFTEPIHAGSGRRRALWEGQSVGLKSGHIQEGKTLDPNPTIGVVGKKCRRCSGLADSEVGDTTESTCSRTSARDSARPEAAGVGGTVERESHNHARAAATLRNQFQIASRSATRNWM